MHTVWFFPHEATEESVANLVSTQCEFRVDRIFNISCLTTYLYAHHSITLLCYKPKYPELNKY